MRRDLDVWCDRLRQRRGLCWTFAGVRGTNWARSPRVSTSARRSWTRSRCRSAPARLIRLSTIRSRAACVPAIPLTVPRSRLLSKLSVDGLQWRKIAVEALCLGRCGRSSSRCYCSSLKTAQAASSVPLGLLCRARRRGRDIIASGSHMSWPAGHLRLRDWPHGKGECVLLGAKCNR